MNKTSKTNKLILCAFFAALTAVCTMITIPLPFSPVPINLAILSVLLAGSLLGAKAGTLSQFVYVCLGAIGLPIFSNFSGGPSVLVGPTGGYIVGYIVTAFIVGTFSDKVCSKKTIYDLGIFNRSYRLLYHGDPMVYVYNENKFMAYSNDVCHSFYPGRRIQNITRIFTYKKIKISVPFPSMLLR
jgi:biotin transporter BioY